MKQLSIVVKPGTPFITAIYVQSTTIALTIMVLLLFAAQPSRADVPFTIRGPGVDPGEFRLTTFADGLNFPVGMAELPDGSVLVGVTNGTSFFNSSQGSLIRLADTDNDGVADSRDVLFDRVPGGGLTSVRTSGDLVFTTGQGSGKPISIFRLGESPTDPLTLLGRIVLTYPGGGWSHPHSALAVRESPGQAGSYDLFFQVGSERNFATTTRTVSLTSTIGATGSLAGDAVHMLTIMDDGSQVTGASPVQIATGLRNPAGFAFHPVTGDLYLQDNGIDGFIDVNEPESADELNVIPRDAIGGDIEDFGFPDNYTQYRTGEVIGGQGIQPLVAFQPIPDPLTGDEGEGPNDVAFAPPLFPESLRNGMFVGMHGRFSLGGRANEENPLVFVNLSDNSYFHFITNDEPGVGHLDGLLATDDSLFVADISPSGGFGGSAANTGAIYQIAYVGEEAPQLQAGDADMDLDFDQADLVQVLRAAVFLNGRSATWGEGDWDGAPGGRPGAPPRGDGVFNQVDIIKALATGNYLTGPYASTSEPARGGDSSVSVLYNAITGEVLVRSAAAANLTSIDISSSAGIFTAEPAEGLHGSFDLDTDHHIFKATFGSSFGSVTFGNVAQPGLSEAYLLGDITVTGSLAEGGEIGPVSLVYVPEPGGMALLAAGFVFTLVGRLQSFVARVLQQYRPRTKSSSAP